MNNSEAEYSLLGTLIYEPGEVAAVKHELLPDHFYSTANRIVYEVILKHDRRGDKIDAEAIAATLVSDGLSQKVNPSYISKILEYPMAVDVNFMVRQIKDMAKRREIRNLANVLLKDSERPDKSNSEFFTDTKRLTSAIKSGLDNLDAHSKPLTEDESRILGVLTERPAELQYLVNFQDHGLIPVETIVAIAGRGGTGKTRFIIQLAAAAAAGTSWTYFTFDRPVKVLLIAAEETQDELDRRIWDACGGEFSENLFAKSVKGKIGPLMCLNGNQPIRSEWFDWFDSTISNHNNLDLLILDPKSRFYGLDENNNDHATQWIMSLEALSIKHKITIAFTSHVGKGNNKISQDMARGGGALVDGCRLEIGMVGMTEEDGEAFGLVNWQNYVQIGVPKINYGPKSAGDAWMKFDESGNLEAANPYAHKTLSMREYLYELLYKEKVNYSRNELVKQKTAKHISDKMRDRFGDFSRRRDMNRAIDALLQSGTLVERYESTGSRPKKLLFIADNEGL